MLLITWVTSTLVYENNFQYEDYAFKFFIYHDIRVVHSQEGWTPLHLAIQGRSRDIAKVLLVNGADKNRRNKVNFYAIKELLMADYTRLSLCKLTLCEDSHLCNLEGLNLDLCLISIYEKFP